MQSKVSMVIPCYNKVNYIEKMFRSIVAQTWDNMELILVNDGSTDGTREVIEIWKSKFERRRFEVVVVDQKNRGQAAAVYEGLKRISGEFICQVDADDELDSEYVSTMAGWLEKNPDYDWAVCDCVFVKENASFYVSTFPCGAESNNMIEKYMLYRMHTSPCLYMVRADYMERCNVIKSYYFEKKGPQEAQLFIPLAFGIGKIKYFPIPLYKYLYLQPETHFSYKATFEDAKKYFQEWYIIVRKTIIALPIDESTKQRLHRIAEIGRLKCLLFFMFEQAWNPEKANELLKEAVCLVNSYFSPSPKILPENIKNPRTFITAIEDNILGIRPKPVKSQRGRMIAWGVLGKNGKELLPQLKGTAIDPIELWDVAGDGITVKQPNLASLTIDDIVLLLPSKREIVEDIVTKLKTTKCNNIMRLDDILLHSRIREYPRFYDGSIKFESKLLTGE